MFEVGSLVKSTRITSWFYGKVMQIKEYNTGSTFKIYPINNGCIQEYEYFLKENENEYPIGHQWLVNRANLKQVNEEDYYKDRYI